MENNSFAGRILKGIGGRLSKLSHNPWREVGVGLLTHKIYKHLPVGKLRTHLLFGKKFYFYSPAELLHGLQEIFIDNLYKQELPGHPYIIDCGANVGLSVIYMKQLYPDAEIVAFEPDERNFELLTRNVESFGLSDVTLRKEAVWKENTMIKFSGEGTTNSKIDNNANILSRDVKAIRLKDLLDRRIDFLKIDIEGAEYDVVKDLEENLHYVNNLFIEYHGSFEKNNELSELLTFIVRNGFRFYIKEAAISYETPFYRRQKGQIPYDIQLNVFCFRLEKK
ncbi:MAG TPA: FkbM family methyltransferase [Puia sp.]|nr:FkbM family methyltransferase [Puia sp.]